MRAKCLQDCFGDICFPDNGKRRLYKKGEIHEIDERLSCAKHFRPLQGSEPP
jgi:hypothetical protein